MIKETKNLEKLKFVGVNKMNQISILISIESPF